MLENCLLFIRNVVDVPTSDFEGNVAEIKSNNNLFLENIIIIFIIIAIFVLIIFLLNKKKNK